MPNVGTDISQSDCQEECVMDMQNLPLFLEEELHVSLDLKDVAHQSHTLEDFDLNTNYAMDQERFKNFASYA